MATANNKSKESAARRFKTLVTEGPEDYRRKYEGKSAAEINAEINERVQQKNQARNARYAEKAAYAEHKHDWMNSYDWSGPARRHRTVMRVFWGVFFLVAALAIGAQLFGFMTFPINIWWLVLAIFLFAIMVASAVGLGWFGVFIPAAGILSIINWQTDWLNWGNDIYLGLFGVALLLSIAFTILFHRKSHWAIYKKAAREEFKKATFAGSDDGSEVVISARLGEAVRYIESKNLEKVFIDCVMGGVKVYFNNTHLASDKLDIHIHGTMGGVVMYMPRNWRIVNGLNATAGGVSEQNRAELTADSPIVRLSGTATMGGVEIVYI